MKILLLAVALLAVVGCKHNESKPQDPVVIVKPPVEPTPPAIPVGAWVKVGGGFSPCAPHSALLDKECHVGDKVESDCAMWECK